MKRIALITICILLLPVTYSWGSAIFHVGNPPDTGSYLYSNELRPIALNEIQFENNSNNSINFDNPLWLIVGVPNAGGSFTAPAISSVSSGSGAFSSGDSKNNFNSGEVYSFLGLNGTGLPQSNNFTNWAGAYNYVTGLTASEFDIMVYLLTNSNPNNGPVDIKFASDFLDGSIALVYGTETGTSGDTKYYGTPFTEAGMADNGGPPIPEPATIFLLGAGLSGIGFLRRRRTP